MSILIYQNETTIASESSWQKCTLKEGFIGVTKIKSYKTKTKSDRYTWMIASKEKEGGASNRLPVAQKPVPHVDDDRCRDVTVHLMMIFLRQEQYQPISFRLWFGTRDKARYKARQQQKKDKQAITTEKTRLYDGRGLNHKEDMLRLYEAQSLPGLDKYLQQHSK